MPKKQNVTNAELDALDGQLTDLLDTADDYANRIKWGYNDEVRDPVWRARMCLGASRRLTDLSLALLNLAEAQELRKQVSQLQR